MSRNPPVSNKSERSADEQHERLRVGEIRTTDAGSLPRPDGFADMIWKRMDGESVDESAIESRLDTAVKEIVQKQRDAAIDVVSDGEMSKTGFSTYVGD